MRALLRSVMVGAGIACASVALAAPKAAGPRAAAPATAKGATPKGATPKAAAPAAPKVNASDQLKLAEEHQKSGKYDEALAAIDAGLAVAPKDASLLELKAEVLLRTDEPRALDAYKALDKVLPPGAKKREVQKIIANLTIKLTTFVEVTVTNGPARVQIGPIRKRVVCPETSSCKKEVAPGDLNVTVERSGFDRWTGRVTAASGKTEPLSVTLTESSSKLAVRVAQPGASVTVDGAAYDPSTPVKPGKHEVVVSLDHHEPARLEAIASLGKPIELDVTLARIVPVRIVSPGAAIQPVPALQLDGKPVSLQDGTLRLQPGAHDLEASAPGFQKDTIKIPAEPAPDYQAVVELRPVIVARPQSWLTFRRKLALVAGGLGLAALGTGAVLGRQAGQLETNANTLCPDPAVPCRYAPEANDFNQRGRARALQANIAFGAAGAAAIAATVLWLTGSPGSPGLRESRESREPRMAVTPRLDGTAAGLDLAVRF